MRKRQISKLNQELMRLRQKKTEYEKEIRKLEHELNYLARIKEVRKQNKHLSFVSKVWEIRYFIESESK